MIRTCLEGVSVLDFTQIGAGPTCTMMLADFGASVVKVEPPSGDLGRHLGPPWYGDHSPVFIAFNRGKRSICIDLKSAGGREVAHRLALKADVVVESFRPGVMDQFGLGYAALAAEHPQLIYCAVSGYGQTGPLAQEAGVDGILQAASGLMGLIGDETTGPCKVQAPIVDVSTGYIGALAVLAALMERQKTGRGSYLDVSLFATAVALQQSAVTSYLGDGQQPRKMGSAAPYSAPNEAFEASDGWIMVAAYIGERWRRLCEILDLPHLVDDSRFKTSGDRVVNRAEMRSILGAAFRRRSCAEWLTLLKDADILCSRVAEYADLLANPQLAHLNMLVDLDHPTEGRFRTPGLPINPRETNRLAFAAPARLGEHAPLILQEFGFTPDEIEGFLNSGAVVRG
jgi:crotonobetainyl-CoA:carnitine CoA-transferase CaiB-like acyl-CoA transferase